ncbi:FAD/NAD(P)-binding domain-containing protein [Ustulina deusta]|nr:FAD/NAD(P)-binding domain-containing protein [Ustulina deusta]
MRLNSPILIASLTLTLPCFAIGPYDIESYASKDVIRRDVAVIGGGASGTYVSIELRDLNKTIIVIERSSQLGGNTRTYLDPKTGVPINYALQIYHDDAITRNFFARLNTSVATTSFNLSTSPVYADFSTGKLLRNYTIPVIGDDYQRELHKYPYLEDGINLPQPIPADLLLATQDYIKKFNLQDSAPAIFDTPAIPGNLLETLMLYTFNDLNTLFLNEEAGAAINNADGDNSELYRNALTELSPDVLLNSTVISANRTGDVKLVVKTPTGNKLVIAKQLVVAMPPVLENMSPFGLNLRERGILSQLSGKPYYSGVVQNTGLPDGHVYKNRATGTAFHVPTLPGAILLNPTDAPGLFYYWFSSETRLSQAEVEGAMRDAIKKLQKLESSATTAEPEFVAFDDHYPFHLAVSSEDIKNGFYDAMYALQGYRNTWYISSLFVIGSSQLWNNTAAMLPRIAAAL